MATRTLSVQNARRPMYSAAACAPALPASRRVVRRPAAQLQPLQPSTRAAAPAAARQSAAHAPARRRRSRHALAAVLARLLVLILCAAALFSVFDLLARHRLLTSLGSLVSEQITGGSSILTVQPVLQQPALPNGCEAASLATLLEYNGYSVDLVPTVMGRTRSRSMRATRPAAQAAGTALRGPLSRRPTPGCGTRAPSCGRKVRPARTWTGLSSCCVRAPRWRCGSPRTTSSPGSTPPSPGRCPTAAPIRPTATCTAWCSPAWTRPSAIWPTPCRAIPASNGTGSSASTPPWAAVRWCCADLYVAFQLLLTAPRGQKPGQP